MEVVVSEVREALAARAVAEKKWAAKDNGVPDGAQVFRVMHLDAKIGDSVLAAVCPTCFAFVPVDQWRGHADWHGAR